MKKIVKKTIAGFTAGVVALYTLPIYAFASTESIYSKLNSNGETYKTIVSVRDNEEVQQKESNQELPIETKITYKLDGEEISIDELVGKSGKVSINIEYINKSAKTVNINGCEELMYTPFVVAVGSIIDNENNKNIETSTGKVIENGSKSIVCGILLPGLQESLKLSGELASIDIPSSIEITMDSTNFEMGNIVSYASPKILDENIDWSKFNDLFDSANLLQESSNQLEEGAKKLVEGTTELKNGTNTLSNGIETVYNGSIQIKSQIASSIASMENSSPKALDDNTLNKISEQAAATATETVKVQLETIGNSAKETAVTTIEGQLDAIGINASTQATAMIENQKDAIAKKAEQTAKSAMSAKENEIFSKIQTYIEKNKNTLIPEEKISQAATKAVGEEATNIITNAATAGAKAGGEIAEKSISSIKASSGDVEVDVSNISIEVDYKAILKNSEEYNNLDDEQKAAIDAVIEEIVGSTEKEAVKQAKLQAEQAAKEAAEIAQKNAENSAKQSAQLAVSQIVTEASTTAAKTAATTTTTELVETAVTAGVNEAMVQLMTNLSSSISVVEDAILPYVGQIANETAKQVAGEVASSTAKATAKQVAENVASETAKTVAVQVTKTVAGNTAKTVADEVADEVKAVATEQIKSQMQTLLNDGINPLTNGLEQINSGAKELNNGAIELESGAQALAEGMGKFNSDGISKITKLINGDLNNLVVRGKKLEQLANAYDSFDSNEKNDSVKFISIIDSARTSKKDEDGQEIINNRNKEEN